MASIKSIYMPRGEVNHRVNLYQNPRSENYENITQQWNTFNSAINNERLAKPVEYNDQSRFGDFPHERNFGEHFNIMNKEFEPQARISQQNFPSIHGNNFDYPSNNIDRTEKGYRHAENYDSYPEFNGNLSGVNNNWNRNYDGNQFSEIRERNFEDLYDENQFPEITRRVDINNSKYNLDVKDNEHNRPARHERLSPGISTQFSIERERNWSGVNPRSNSFNQPNFELGHPQREEFLHYENMTHRDDNNWKHLNERQFLGRRDLKMDSNGIFNDWKEAKSINQRRERDSLQDIDYDSRPRIDQDKIGETPFNVERDFIRSLPQNNHGDARIFNDIDESFVNHSENFSMSSGASREERERISDRAESFSHNYHPQDARQSVRDYEISESSNGPRKRRSVFDGRLGSYADKSRTDFEHSVAIPPSNFKVNNPNRPFRDFEARVNEYAEHSGNHHEYSDRNHFREHMFNLRDLPLQYGEITREKPYIPESEFDNFPNEFDSFCERRPSSRSSFGQSHYSDTRRRDNYRRSPSRPSSRSLFAKSHYSDTHRRDGYRRSLSRIEKDHRKLKGIGQEKTEEVKKKKRPEKKYLGNGGKMTPTQRHRRAMLRRKDKIVSRLKKLTPKQTITKAKLEKEMAEVELKADELTEKVKLEQENKLIKEILYGDEK